MSRNVYKKSSQYFNADADADRRSKFLEYIPLMYHIKYILQLKNIEIMKQSI